MDPARDGSVGGHVGGLANDNLFGKITMKEASDLERNENQEVQTFKSVLYYSVLILLVPVLTFFVFKSFVLGSVLQWDSDQIKTNVVSAIAAVIVLHLALGLFIAKAYFGETDVKRKIGKSD